MDKFLALMPYKINKKHSDEIIFINPEMICAIFPIDENFTQINMVNGDQIVANIEINKLIENLRNG